MLSQSCKRDAFTGSNREKFNISIAILTKLIIFRKAEERARRELEKKREKLAEEIKSKVKRLNAIYIFYAQIWFG